MSERDQPIVLYYDAATDAARAAAVPAGNDEASTSFLFGGLRVRYAGEGLMFYDYLVRPNNDIVGILLNDFMFDERLVNSQLLTAAKNVTRNTIGYEVLLTDSTDSNSDASQAFGTALFHNGDDYFLYLGDFHCRGYAFDLDRGLISPIA